VAISLQPETPGTANEWSVTSMDASNGGAPWDLYLAFIPKPAGLTGRIQYNTDLFRPATITRMVSHLQLTMRAAIADTEQRVSRMLRIALN